MTVASARQWPLQLMYRLAGNNWRVLSCNGGQETSQLFVNCDEGTYHRGLGLDDQVWWSFNNVQFWFIFCWHKICQLTHVKTSSADHQQNICFPFYFLHPPSNIIKSYIYPKTSLRLYSFFAVSDCSIDSLTMTDSKGMFVDLCPTSHDY